MTVRIVDVAATELAMRLIVGNRLPLSLLENALATTPEVVTAIAAGKPVSLWPGEHELLVLFTATLVRLEVRVGYDPHRVRAMLSTPLAALDGRTPAAVLATGKWDELRAVHRAVGDMALPQERWWRVAPRR